MQLSEAIRLGAMLRPQRFGIEDTASDGSCALMAANEAVGNRMGDFRGALCTFPLLEEKRSCPVCGEVQEVHWIIAIHLNDTYRWTRERIADWVATLEPHDEIPPLGETERSSPVSAGSGSGVP